MQNLNDQKKNGQFVNSKLGHCFMERSHDEIMVENQRCETEKLFHHNPSHYFDSSSFGAHKALKSIPPPNYYCHLCHKPGHFIYHCPNYEKRDDSISAIPKKHNNCTTDPYTTRQSEKSSSFRSVENPSSISAATPYQGRKRCFGEFHCAKCSRRWHSSNSWANMGQICNRCDSIVYPDRQWPVINRLGLNNVTVPARGCGLSLQLSQNQRQELFTQSDWRKTHLHRKPLDIITQNEYFRKIKEPLSGFLSANNLNDCNGLTVCHNDEFRDPFNCNNIDILDSVDVQKTETSTTCSDITPELLHKEFSSPIRSVGNLLDMEIVLESLMASSK